MRVLVVVASKHGSTYEIAAAIAEELRGAQFTVDLHDLQAEGGVGDLAGYHAVVLGSAIYAGSWLPAARAFAALPIQTRSNRRPPVQAGRSASAIELGLTRREQEVLCLVVEGCTDREIAERLFISRRTASKHVEAILAKLGVPSRRAAAAAARRQGLIQACPPKVTTSGCL